jgi:hypothetical protein
MKTRTWDGDFDKISRGHDGGARKCPRMCSDHLRTMPNALLLERFLSTCKEERERESVLEALWSVWWRKRWAGEDKPRLPQSHWNPAGADRLRLASRLSACHLCDTDRTASISGQFLLSPMDRPVSIGGLSATHIFGSVCSVMFLYVLANFLQTVHLLPADCPPCTVQTA